MQTMAVVRAKVAQVAYAVVNAAHARILLAVGEHNKI